ncbi:hypothetical protein D3C81_1875750 [compost metagenome]
MYASFAQHTRIYRQKCGLVALGQIFITVLAHSQLHYLLCANAKRIFPYWFVIFLKNMPEKLR